MRAQGNIPKWVAVAISMGTLAVMRTGWAFLRAKKKAQRAERRFRSQLVSGGMDEETARRLSERYIETLRLRKLVKQAIRGQSPLARH